jgi:hypothetical protein
MSDQAAPLSPPRRRFVPEPIETTRSSKRQHQGKPAIQHVEDTEEGPNIENKEPEIHVTPKTPVADPPRRRFAPEPVETSTKSSRKKFTPEPVETSTRSSKDKKKDEDSDEKPPGRRKFLPKPVETSSTSTRRRRKVPEPAEDEEHSPSHADLDLSRSSSTTSSSSRKFNPEVIEVARGSYRKDRSSSGHSSPPKGQLPSPPESPETSKAELAEPGESRFSAAALAKRNHQNRKHSFQVTELPIIESDSNDEGNMPGLSDISSSASDTDRSFAHTGPTYHAIDRKPVNVHELAPVTTDKELTDRILAAYINERPYEPVAHFAVEDEDDIHIGKLSGVDGVDIKTFRRDSGTEHDWELQNMQRHHAQLEKMKNDLKKDTAGTSRYSAATLAARHHGIGNKKEKKRAKDDELKKMRNAASPPMLGDDLIFPLSLSPKMTRCDVDQIPRPRTNDDHEYEEVEGDPMLWQTHGNVSVASNAGLWGGLCQKADTISRPATPLRSGLQTPAFEGGNPFESPRPRTPGTKTPSRRHKITYSNSHLFPLTPPRDVGEDLFTASIDKKLNLEREFDVQFPAAVITQIYNYISLGYPVLAHQFDEELSKISRIPVHELRKDDDAADAKGHVGVPEREEDGAKCKRWEALRLYCKEWWKQSPQMAEKGPEDWGRENRVRRGSWNR